MVVVGLLFVTTTLLALLVRGVWLTILNLHVNIYLSMGVQSAGSPFSVSSPHLK